MPRPSRVPEAPADAGGPERPCRRRRRGRGATRRRRDRPGRRLFRDAAPRCHPDCSRAGTGSMFGSRSRPGETSDRLRVRHRTCADHRGADPGQDPPISARRSPPTTRTTTAARRHPQGRVHVHGRSRPAHRPARGVRLHGRVVVRIGHAHERRRAHHERPRSRPHRPPRADRRGHRRLRPHARATSARTCRRAARVARGVRAARQGRSAEDRDRPEVRRLSRSRPTS